MPHSKELIPVLKLFKTEREKILPNPFNEANINFKTGKDKKKVLLTNTLDKHTCEDCVQNNI